MKLELKHLTPYLPYGLKILNGWGDIKTLNYTHLDDEGNGFIKHVKPILRPLSDLNNAKLFDNYGDEKLTAVEEFSGNWDLGALDWVLLEVSKGNQVERLLELSYLVIEKLIEHHFDIFGLIEAGLALNYNDINL